MSPSTHRFTIFADYFQFVLMDQTSEDDFSAIWSEEALSRMLAVGRTAVCPGTFRNVDVAVEVRLQVERPTVNLSEYDHATEASIDIPSGRLIVMGCTSHLPDAPTIELVPGTYCLLSLVSGINSITLEWDQADDLYTVYLWPGERREPRLIKHWKKDAA